MDGASEQAGFEPVMMVDVADSAADDVARRLQDFVEVRQREAAQAEALSEEAADSCKALFRMAALLPTSAGAELRKITTDLMEAVVEGGDLRAGFLTRYASQAPMEAGPRRGRGRPRGTGKGRRSKREAAEVDQASVAASEE